MLALFLSLLLSLAAARGFPNGMPGHRPGIDCKCSGGDGYGETCTKDDHDRLWCYLDEASEGACADATYSWAYAGWYWSETACIGQVEVCPAGCISWFDGCNSCSCSDGRTALCTRIGCTTREEPRCLRFSSG
eukprot:UN22815